MLRQAIIIGASGGLGRALSSYLTYQVERIVLVGRNEKSLVLLAEELDSVSKAQITIQYLEAQDKKSISSFLTWLECQEPSIIIYAFGKAVFHQEKLSPTEESELWQVNYFLPKEIVSKLAEGKLPHHFIHLDSLSAIIPHPYMKEYTASKAAAHHLFLAWSEELKRSNTNTKLYQFIVGPVSTDILPENLRQNLGGGQFQLSPDKAAQLIIQAYLNNRAYRILGVSTYFFIVLFKRLPVHLQMKILGIYLGRGQRE